MSNRIVANLRIFFIAQKTRNLANSFQLADALGKLFGAIEVKIRNSRIPELPFFIEDISFLDWTTTSHICVNGLAVHPNLIELALSHSSRLIVLRCHISHNQISGAELSWRLKINQAQCN